jgi:hypothetical protein
MRSSYRILVENTDGKRPLGKLAKIILKGILGEIWCGDVGWINPAHNSIHWRALLNAVMKVPVA